MIEKDDYTLSPNEIIHAFIELIKQNRENQGLSVRGLADKAQVSYTVIYDLENRNILPKIETINKLANALNLSINIKCYTVDNVPSLTVLYCKRGHEKELSAKLGVSLRAKKEHIAPTEKLKSYLAQRGLYQKEIEEIENYIEFKLSQH